MSSRRNRYLWIVGASISTFGASALWLAAGVWVKDVTGSNAFAGLAFLAYLAPTLMAPLLGLLADRTRRKPLLLWGSVALAGWVLLALLAQDESRIWLVYLVLVGLGVGANLTAAAASAFTTLVVPYEDLGKVNAFMRTVKEIGLLSAPLAGAVLYVQLGIGAVVLLNAATLLVAAACVAGVRIGEPAPTPRRGAVGRELVRGAVFVFRTGTLRSIIFALGGSLLVFGFFETAIFAVVDDGLGRSAAFVGPLSAIKGTGSVAGGLLSARLVDQLGESRLTAVGLLLVAAGTAVMQVPQVAVVMVSCLVIGLGIPMAVVGLYTAVQRHSPPGPARPGVRRGGLVGHHAAGDLRRARCRVDRHGRLPTDARRCRHRRWRQRGGAVPSPAQPRGTGDRWSRGRVGTAVTRMALDVDLSDPRTHAELDLGPLWRRLRRDDPVCLHPETARTSPFWVVTRYVDTVNVYLDAATFVSAHGNVLDTVARGGDSASGLMLPVTDGPRHRAVRQAVRAAITPRVLARPGDAVVTSDPGDLHRLLDHLRVNASIIAI